jgi:hypothetical protein
MVSDGTQNSLYKLAIPSAEKDIERNRRRDKDRDQSMMESETET